MEHWFDMFKVNDSDNGKTSMTSFLSAYFKSIQNINILFPVEVGHAFTLCKIKLLLICGLLINMNLILFFIFLIQQLKNQFFC